MIFIFFSLYLVEFVSEKSGFECFFYGFLAFFYMCLMLFIRFFMFLCEIFIKIFVF